MHNTIDPCHPRPSRLHREHRLIFRSPEQPSAASQPEEASQQHEKTAQGPSLRSTQDLLSMRDAALAEHAATSAKIQATALRQPDPVSEISSRETAHASAERAALEHAVENALQETAATLEQRRSSLGARIDAVTREQRSVSLAARLLTFGRLDAHKNEERLHLQRSYSAVTSALDALAPLQRNRLDSLSNAQITSLLQRINALRFAQRLGPIVPGQTPAQYTETMREMQQFRTDRIREFYAREKEELRSLDTALGKAEYGLQVADTVLDYIPGPPFGGVAKAIVRLLHNADGHGNSYGATRCAVDIGLSFIGGKAAGKAVQSSRDVLGMIMRSNAGAQAVHLLEQAASNVAKNPQVALALVRSAAENFAHWGAEIGLQKTSHAARTQWTDTPS